MKKVFFALLAFFLLVNPFTRAQDSTRSIAIGIRHNGHTGFFKHPKIGLPGGPMGFPGSSYYKMLKSSESFYYEGAGIIISREKYFYRLWVDYYNYSNRANHSIHFGIVNSQGGIVFGDYRYSTNGFRFSPGLGKEFTWKFMSFCIGAEIPLFIQGSIRVRSTQEDYPMPNELVVINQKVPAGSYSVALAGYAGVNFHFLRAMSAGLEFSNGWQYKRQNNMADEHIEYYDATGKLSKTENNKNGSANDVFTEQQWYYLIPSLSLSYRL